MSHQRKPEINFHYVYNYNYNPTYANGVQGGFTPRGELVVHFYQERPALPKELTHEITPEGSIGAMTDSDPKNLNSLMVRFIESGVTMNFSQFGGGAAVAATHSGGIWTATYTIVAGSIDNQNNRNVSVTATDNVGNTTTVAGADNVTVDNQPPSAPGAPDLAAASDSGSSDTDNLTGDTTPTLSGVDAVASSTVTIISSLVGTLGTATADGSGHWSFTPGTPLAAGTHSITATTSDAAGNVSAASSALSLSSPLNDCAILSAASQSPASASATA